MPEHVLRFGDGARLLGLFNQPAEMANRPAMLLLNAGVVHHIGPHRLSVKIARAFADRGVASLRFDLSGLGDSAPAPDMLGFVEQSSVDISAAIDAVESQLGQSFCGVVAFGICSGADNAYRAALKDPRINGIMLVDPYAYENKKAKLTLLGDKARDPARWARALDRAVVQTVDAIGSVVAGNRDAVHDNHDHVDDADAGDIADADILERMTPPLHEFAGDLQTLADRNVKILMHYTNSVEDCISRPAHFFETFAGYELEGRVDVIVDRDVDHVFTLLGAQQKLLERIFRWFDHAFPGTGVRGDAS